MNPYKKPVPTGEAEDAGSITAYSTGTAYTGGSIYYAINAGSAGLSAGPNAARNGAADSIGVAGNSPSTD